MDQFESTNPEQRNDGELERLLYVVRRRQTRHSFIKPVNKGTDDITGNQREHDASCESDGEVISDKKRRKVQNMII